MMWDVGAVSEFSTVRSPISIKLSRVHDKDRACLRKGEVSLTIDVPHRVYIHRSLVPSQSTRVTSSVFFSLQCLGLGKGIETFVHTPDIYRILTPFGVRQWSAGY